MPSGEEPAERTLWRVFPRDPEAPEGTPFSARYVRPAHLQTKGQFDLGTSPVLYLAETPAHAVAELLRPFAGQQIGAAELRGGGHPLALVEVILPAAVNSALVDLTDPETLVRYGIRPDALASLERRRTQEIARSLHAAGVPGFRWWSALHGDWHAVLLFLDRVAVSTLRYGTLEALSLTHAAVLGAARVLNPRV